MFRTILSAIALTLVLATSASAEGEIQIPTDVGYAAEAAVPQNIRNECTTLGTKLSTFIEQYASSNGVATKRVEKLGKSGRALRAEFTQAMSSGNAFIGHQKSMTVRVELFENGESQGSTTLTRNSMGGFAGGFKGSCSVLGRITKALGRDVADWLKTQ